MCDETRNSCDGYRDRGFIDRTGAGPNHEWVSISPEPSQPRGGLPVACSIVFRMPRMVSRSCSGLRPARFVELVVPWPINSQPRFFISSIALGWTSQTCEFKATVALTPASSQYVGHAPQPDAHPVFPPGVVENVGHVVRGIGRNADADG